MLTHWHHVFQFVRVRKKEGTSVSFKTRIAVLLHKFSFAEILHPALETVQRKMKTPKNLKKIINTRNDCYKKIERVTVM